MCSSSVRENRRNMQNDKYAELCSHTTHTFPTTIQNTSCQIYTYPILQPHTTEVKVKIKNICTDKHVHFFSPSEYNTDSKSESNNKKSFKNDFPDSLPPSSPNSSPRGGKKLLHLHIYKYFTNSKLPILTVPFLFNMSFETILLLCNMLSMSH